MDSGKRTDQARLRLVKSDDFDLCSSCNLTAAPPLGSLVRPVSISLMADGERPTSSPIAASVNPVVRRSETSDAHEVMRPSLRPAVDRSQRLPVTEFRDNSGMPKPPDMPREPATRGARVLYWRKKRGISRKNLAKEVGYSIGALSDLESGRSKSSEKLHLIAAALTLNPHYLDSGLGEPESAFPQEPPPPQNDDFPFPGLRSRLKRLNKIERGYLETEIHKTLDEIESERRNKTG